MALDRRIVAILQHNGIYDVNRIEKFVGLTSDMYYEVIINGQSLKLKIPDQEYSIVQEAKQQPKEKKPKEVKKKKEKVKDIVEPEPDANIEKAMESIEEDASLFKVTKVVKTVKSPKVSDKNIKIVETNKEDLIEPNEDDINDFVNVI